MIAADPGRWNDTHAGGSPAPRGSVAISVHEVGKMYRLYDRPQDRLKEQLLWRFGRSYGREFWALHDVSFEVNRGEAVGIIGRNGSGKSTLLQIIAGTLTPTTGEATVAGRVAALLELGSGFNPEFTGRENVFLNGAILGIGRADMERRFDAIAAFADIGAFIDQPVKVFSSGMVVRLAFSVQAHVDADVLIIDEALAVGDIQFQHRCMRRIKQLVDGGVTLLFVSHATDAVKRFCRRGIWLDAGEVRYSGEAGVAVEKYLAHLRMRDQEAAAPAEPDDGDGRTPPAFELGALPSVSGRIDLAVDALFLAGGWSWKALPDVPLPLRHTSDPGALAGFRCRGTRLELAFVVTPASSALRVTLDGEARVIDPARTGGSRIEKVSLPLLPGDHAVLIGPAAVRPGGGEVWWLGGCVVTSPALVFRDDPGFGSGASAVERYGTGKARFTAVQLLDYASEAPLTEVAFGQRVRLRLHAERFEPIGPRIEFSYIVRDRNRVDLFGTTTVDEHVRLDPRAQRFVVEFAFDVRLGRGSYSILVAFVECSENLTSRLPLDHVDIATVFTVTADPSRPVWYLYHEPVEVSAMIYEGTSA